MIILETLTPAAGSNSLRVTTGPWLIFFIFPLTPKSRRIFSKKLGSLFSLLFEFSLSFLFGIFNRSNDGNLKIELLEAWIFSALIKGKSS